MIDTALESAQLATRVAPEDATQVVGGGVGEGGESAVDACALGVGGDRGHDVDLEEEIVELVGRAAEDDTYSRTRGPSGDVF